MQPDSPLELERSERLVFRPVTQEDRAFLLQLFSRKKVTRYYDHGKPKSPDEIDLEIENALRSRERRDYDVWILSESETGRQVGYGGFAEAYVIGTIIFYALLPEAWGQGYATEFVQHALELARTRYGIDRVHATVMRPNKASRRVLEKAGMRLLNYVPEWRRLIYVTPDSGSAENETP